MHQLELHTGIMTKVLLAAKASRSVYLATVSLRLVLNRTLQNELLIVSHFNEEF